VSPIIQSLRHLNSKERFFLVGYALGNQDFAICATFRDAVSNALNINVPAQLFSAMDYHLDWIHASLQMAKCPGTKIFSNAAGHIKATQEDIDFVLAFEDLAGATHIIMLEAKGLTGWNNAQMQSKMRRLTNIFGEDALTGLKVNPVFAILSPREPQGLDTANWPHWAKPQGKPLWIKLPGTDGRLKIQRCDGTGRKTKEGNYWSMVAR
jgi:hypothetical protein